MAKKLFVGGLPFSYSNDELRALFVEAGTVLSAEMVPDPAWGRTRGFGFVEMSTPIEAQAAIAKLNGMKIGEKNIYVTEAREKKPTPPPAAKNPSSDRRPPPKAGRIPRGDRFNSSPGVFDPARGTPPRKNTRDFPDRPSFPGSRPPSDRPARAPGDFPASRPSSDRPERTPGAFGNARKSFFRRPPSGPRGDERKPYSSPGRPRGDAGPGSRRPGGFSAPSSGGAPRTGFSRPNKWEPRGDDKRSFSPPRTSRGDFGPSHRKPGFPASPGFGEGNRRPSKPFGKPSSRPGAPPKKEFWKKFEKKKPS